MKTFKHLSKDSTKWIKQPDLELVNSSGAIIQMKSISFSHYDHYAHSNSDETVTLGHEGVGIIKTLGNDNHNLKIGDRVSVNCITKCGSCQTCKKTNNYSCDKYGYWLGVNGDGTHSEELFIPNAELNLVKLPESISDKTGILLSDIVSTTYENVVLKMQQYPAKINKMAIIGDGPIGAATVIWVKEFFPNVEITVLGHYDNKLSGMKKLGADYIINVNTAEPQYNKYEIVLQATGNAKQAWPMGEKMLSYNGLYIIVGIFTSPLPIDIELLSIKYITITTGYLQNMHSREIIKLIEKRNINFDILYGEEVFAWNNIEKALDYKPVAGWKVLVQN